MVVHAAEVRRALREELAARYELPIRPPPPRPGVLADVNPPFVQHLNYEDCLDDWWIVPTAGVYFDPVASNVKIPSGDILYWTTRGCYGFCRFFGNWGTAPGAGVVEYMWLARWVDRAGFEISGATFRATVRVQGTTYAQTIPWDADYLNDHVWEIRWFPERCEFWVHPADLVTRGTKLAEIPYSPENALRPYIRNGSAVAIGDEITLRAMDYQSFQSTLTEKFGNLIRHMYGNDQVFTDEEIRDTNAHNSPVVDCRTFKNKTVLAVSDLDQPLSCQIQGAYDEDFTDPTDLGAPFTVPIGSVTTERRYETNDDYFPWIRVVVTATGVPTAGDLNMWVMPI